MGVVKLSRLPNNWRDQPQLFETYWDDTMNKIEETLNAILAIPVIEEGLEDARTLAIQAQNTADSVGVVSDAQRKENSIVNSYVANFTAPLISADSLGNVTIKDHDRVYGDGDLNPTRSVDGETIATGESTGSVLRFYYDDATRAGGAVTYAYSVDPASSPVQSGDRHSVAAVEIPAAGTVDGKYLQPPGFILL